MSLRRLLVYRFSSSIFRLAVPILLALACSGITFGGEIHEAARKGDLKRVQALLHKDPALISAKDEYAMTALHCAVRHPDVLEFLLANKADVEAKDDKGNTPLIYAVIAGANKVLPLLLAQGANVNAKADSGMTPLHWAAYSGNTDAADVLLAHKADINAKEKSGMTPLRVAVNDGRSGFAELLLSHGADANAASDSGDTPLHVAVSKGQKNVVELLVTNGANVDATDNKGFTPLAFATRLGKNDIVEFLLAHGAKESSGETTSGSSTASSDQDLIRQLSGGMAKARAPRKVDPYDHNQSTEHVSANTKGTVYFFRAHQIVGAPLKPSISCDGAELAHMQNGRYFRVQVEPGRHSFYSKDSRTDLVVAPGGIYYIEAKVIPFTEKALGLRLLPAEETPAAMHKVKALDDKAIVDHTRVSAGGEIPDSPAEGR